MDDMHALERLVATEMLRRAGPEPVVDDAAIFDAITTTHSVTWMVHPSFSVTKLVASAAVVALFGAILLAGVSTRQSDDLAPAAATDSPSPAATEELLSSMVTEEVEPGVYRVRDDGAGHDLVAEPPANLTVASDGSVWPPRRSSQARTEDWPDTPEWVDAVIRLGQSGTHPFQPDEPSHHQGSALAIDQDGLAWTTIGTSELERGMLASLDGTACSSTWPDGSSDVAAIEATSDGTVWVTQQVEDGPGPRVARIVDGDWTMLPPLEDPARPGSSDGADPYPLPGLEDPDLSGFFHGADQYFAASPDGTAWLANGDLHRCFVAPAPQGLHFDGTGWELVDTQVDGRSWLAGPLALGPDGTLWVYLELPIGCGPSRNDRPGYLARLDADGWRLFTPEADGVPKLNRFGGWDADMAVDAAGTLWLGDPVRGVLAFDGSDWRR